MANFYAQYPAGAAGSNASVGTNGLPAPTSSTEIGFIDGSGNEQGVSPSNPLPVTVVSGPNPTNVNVADFGGNVVVTGTGASGLGIPRVTVSNDSNILATQSGTWNINNISGTISLPTGAATNAALVTINTTLGSPFQAGGAIGNTSFQATQPTASLLNATVLGTTAAGSGAATGLVTVQGNASGTPIPISAASFPLPTGAATAANQATIIANQTNASQKTQVVDNNGVIQGPATTLGGVNYMPVVLAASATPGSALVARSIQIAGSDGTNARTVSTDTSGRVNVNIDSIDTAPATQNITIQDTGSASTAQANGQNAITGTPTAGSTASFSVSSQNSYDVQVTGTWTGTLANEISIDGGVTWFQRGIKQTGSSYISSAFTNNFEASGNVTGATNVRVRATTAVTGTATVKIILSNNPYVSIITNPLTLRDATTQSISNTIKAASTAAVATDTALVVAISPNNNIPVAPPAAATAQAFSFTGIASQTYNVSQYSTLSVVVTSAGSGNIWVYEVTNDGVNWEGIYAYPLQGGPAVLGSQANGQWVVNVSAFQQFRIRMAFYSSGTVAGTMYELPAGQIFPTGQQSQLTSMPVALALEDIQELWTAGASAQTATVNNILTSPSQSTPLDTTGYRSFSCQVISTGTGGTFIFEGSNDGTNFVGVPVFNVTLLTGVPIVAAITASSSNIIYQGNCNFRYLRLRIATTITGGSITAYSALSQAPFSATSQIVAQSANANLNVAATITSGTVNAVTNANLGIPNTVTDVASAAIAVTTTTAAFTPTNGSSYNVEISVTAASGTAETMQTSIQESQDAGTNWYTVYSFPVITATGFYTSPVLMLGGNRLRYVQTITGSTPSFTRSITRLQGSQQIPSYYRNLFDSTINPTSTNSTTAVLNVENMNTYTAIINQGAGGSAVSFALDGSDDNVNWVSAISTVNGVVGGSTPVTMSYAGSAFRFIRARVITGVAATTISYVTLIGSMGSKASSSTGLLTNRSGSTSGTPSTSTQVAGPNSIRKYFFIQNLDLSATIFVNFGAAADTTNSLSLVPGQAFTMEGTFIDTEAINVLSSGTSIKYAAKEG